MANGIGSNPAYRFARNFIALTANGGITTAEFMAMGPMLTQVVGAAASGKIPPAAVAFLFSVVNYAAYRAIRMIYARGRDRMGPFVMGPFKP